MKKMTFLEAALKVLEEAGGGPMRYEDISDQAMRDGLIHTRGTTPEATLAARLYMHIKQAEAKAEEPLVKQTGPGQFALNRKQKRGPLRSLEESDKEVKKRLRQRLSELHPRTFENLIGGMLGSIGFDNVEVSKYSGDGGLDVEAELTVGGVTNVKTAIQVKRWKNNVPGRVVRELRGALMTDQRGLIITTSAFTKEAQSEAVAPGKTPISLIDGDALMRLLVENQLGVKRKSVTYLELDLEALDEFEDAAQGDDRDRRLSLWPLPGGADNFVVSATDMLRFVAQAEPGPEEFAEWIASHFPKVTSGKTAKSYVYVLRVLDLIKLDGETFALTDDGADWLAGDANTVALRQLRARVLGVEEYLQVLKDTPMSIDESHTFFLNTCNTNWETQHQTLFRVRWLQSCQAIESNDGKYRLAQ